jgi:hypothetical protein
LNELDGGGKFSGFCDCLFLDNILRTESVHSILRRNPNFDELIGTNDPKGIVEVRVETSSLNLIEDLILWMETANVNISITIHPRIFRSEIKLFVSLLNTRAKIVRFALHIGNSEDVLDETILNEIARVIPCCCFLHELVLTVETDISRESWVSLATAIMHNRSLNIVKFNVQGFDEEIFKDSILPLIEKNPKLSNFLVFCGSVLCEFPSLVAFNKIGSHCQRLISKYFIGLVGQLIT